MSIKLRKAWLTKVKTMKLNMSKITKKPIGLMLPLCTYQEFLHRQLSHQNKYTTDDKPSPLQKILKYLN